MINLKIILLFVTICTFLFNSCVPHSKEILIYKGKVDLELGDYCSMAGRIVESNSNKPLIGANILVVSKTLGVSTDKSGSYIIEKIPPGVYDIKVSYIGYYPLEISNFTFEKNNYYLVDFELLFQD